MREFKDDEGRPWRLALTVAAAIRVRDMVTVDVTASDGTTKPMPFNMVNESSIPHTFEVLRTQYDKVGEILYAILLKQVADKGLDKESFLEGLRGDSLQAAIHVLQEELVDFFPQRLRKTLRLMIAKMDAYQAKVVGDAEAGLEMTSVETLMAASGASSGNVPESLESTQESGPSVSSSSLETAA